MIDSDESSFGDVSRSMNSPLLARTDSTEELTATTATNSSTRTDNTPIHPQIRNKPQNDNANPIELDILRPKRILDRDGRFHQSLGKWRVRQCTANAQRYIRGPLYWQDWFHSLLYLPTWCLLLFLAACYTSTILLFGVFYYLLSHVGAHFYPNGDGYCGMAIDNYMEAFYFSLSTMTTIGYGVSDYYFGDCWSPFALVLFQVLCAVLFDAVAIGLIFQRMSRGQNRSRTILFSDMAVVRRIRGKLYFMFRIAELRRHHLVEAHVRLYCVRHERWPVDASSSSRREEGGVPVNTAYYHTHHVKLRHPDDGMGAYILMALPSIVVHEIDDTSPLMPDKIWYDANGRRMQRVVDEEQSDTDLPHHLSPSSKHSRNEQTLKEQHYISQQNEIQSFLSDREAELIVLVEGTDEMTGSVLQARHSYRWDDICWNRMFAPCVERQMPRDGWKCKRSKTVCVIDFSKFHDLVEVPLNSDSDPAMYFVR